MASTAGYAEQDVKLCLINWSILLLYHTCYCTPSLPMEYTKYIPHSVRHLKFNICGTKKMGLDITFMIGILHSDTYNSTDRCSCFYTTDVPSWKHLYISDKRHVILWSSEHYICGITIRCQITVQPVLRDYSSSYQRFKQKVHPL